MKNILILSIISTFISFVFISCSDDPSTAPDDNADPGISEVIGVNGGEVVNDELTINIPPGAFNRDHSITISKVTNNGSFGTNSVSKSYKISGLPIEYYKPLELKIKYNKPLSGVSLIAVGEEVFDSSSGTTSTIYNPIEAIDSAGYIIAELIDSTSGLGKMNGSASSLVDDYDKFIEGITNYAWAISNRNWISYPVSLLSEVAEVGAKLDSAYNIAYRLQLYYYTGEGSDRVFIKFQDNVLRGRWTKRSTYFNLSRSHVEQKKYSEIKMAMGMELLAREFDSFWNPWSIEKWWFDSAILNYTEELFTDDLNFKYPVNFETNAMAPFNGIGAAVGKSIELQEIHGAGMASVLKYLAEDPRFGKQGISNTYNNLPVYRNTIEALLQTVNGQLIDWHPDFFKKYLTGEVYDLPKDYFINNTQHEWTISSDVDTEKVYSSNNFLVGNYLDLSAKLFKINLNYPNLTETHDMLLSMKGIGSELGLSLLVFGIKNGNTVFLGSSYAQNFELKNLYGFYSDNMRQFLVVLVNSNGVSPFTSETSIDLTIKVIKGSQGGGSFDLTNNKCSVSLNVLADFIYQTADTAYFITEPLIMGSQIVSGSFTGNTFTGTFDNNGYSDTIIVTLNGSLDMVTEVYWSGIEENAAWNILWRKGYEAANIPIKVSDNTVFELSGTGVCYSLSNVVYSYKNFNSMKDIEDFTCNENSYVYIGFFKE